MYSTCIHCAASLGRNESIEAFPVGRRLAFDAAKGRLWVVCRACERWNLSPLEERWEAVEDAERRFREARLRVSTDEIGLARLRDGLDLIRIGTPRRPEMAAWRYGDQFGRRRRKQMLLSGAALAGAATAVGAFAWIGTSAAAFSGFYGQIGTLTDRILNGAPGKVVAKVATAGAVLTVQRRHARMSAIERADHMHADDPASFQLRLEHSAGTEWLLGAEARRVAAQIMPTVNRFGGSKKKVQEAVGLLERAGAADRVLLRIQHEFGAMTGQRPKYPKKGHDITLQKAPGTFYALPSRERLALEMALHEESERRAMDGELEELTRAWRDAETVAQISDDMFVTSSVDARLGALRDARGQPAADPDQGRP